MQVYELKRVPERPFSTFDELPDQIQLDLAAVN